MPLEPLPEPVRPLVATGMAKDPRSRPADAASLVTELKTIASGAYGQDWERRGRSHLGEAALLLAALWPMGGPPAQQGTAVDRVQLHEHGPRPRPRLHPRLLRHLRPMPAAIVIAAGIAVVAAGTALAAPVSKNQGTQKRNRDTSTRRGAADLAPANAIRIGHAIAEHEPGVPTPKHPGQPFFGVRIQSTRPTSSVKYLDGTDANATISGQVANVVSGEVAELYAQQFPFTSPPRLKSARLPSTHRVRPPSTRSR